MRWMTTGVGALCAGWFALGLQTGADEITEQNRAEKLGISVRLVDPAGRPLEGAEVGLVAASGDANFRDTGWVYGYGPERSDHEGVARLDGAVRWLNGRRFSLTARLREKGLIAVENLDPEQIGRLHTLVMRPECHVIGRLRCGELEGAGRSLRGITVIARLGRHLAAEYWSMEPEFELFLPPGEYNLEIRSDPPVTHPVVRPLVVPEGAQRLELGPIDLHLTEYSRLEGRRAPELRRVAAWKNGSPGRLADLRGKVVLLDFWGWWCGPCVQGMPELFDLYDRYRDEGLIIIGVHVDHDEKDGVVTSDELDRKLAAIREALWGGRDIPFSVALATPELQRSGGDAGGLAPCAIAADYGIESYPTMILIDKQGRVIGRVSERDLIDRIEAALSEK